MKQIFLVAFTTITAISFGQSPKWQISVQLQPEITLHKDSYRWWKENSDKSTFNIGIASTAQYNTSKRFFLSSGIGFISRTLQTANFLDQAALPPPNQSFSQELVTTKSVSYRLLPLTFNFGYHFLSTDKIQGFITNGFSGNYLLNTYYKSNFSRYDGAYKKNYWQGYSLTVGLGTNYSLTKKIQATATLSYAIVNHVKQDEYIQNQGGNGLVLEHNYVNLSIGVKLPL